MRYKSSRKEFILGGEGVLRRSRMEKRRCVEVGPLFTDIKIVRDKNKDLLEEEGRGPLKSD